MHASPRQSPKHWYEEINPHLSESDELAPSAPSYPVPGPAKHPPPPNLYTRFQSHPHLQQAANGVHLDSQLRQINSYSKGKEANTGKAYQRQCKSPHNLEEEKQEKKKLADSNLIAACHQAVHHSKPLD